MTGEGRVPISIVCVYNDPAVLASCLERSVDLGRREAPQVELIAIDNRDQRFTSAGAALNHGARDARHPVVAFVHQDVYLHSLAALEAAGALLVANPEVGMLGAVGITPLGQVAGIVRDRVVMLGNPSDGVTEVDSLDEVLFMLRREDVLASPLTDDPDLAWHAYAVEYAAREHSRGRRVLTVDSALTHNSMTLNLDRLAEAHARIADLYPNIVPLQTTCGVVRAPDDRSRLRTLARRRRGLATWLDESRTAWRLSRATHMPYSDVVLGDVRLEIDDLLDLVDAGGLDVVNVEISPTSSWDVVGLVRRKRQYSARQVARSELSAVIAAREPGRALLLTGQLQDWVQAATTDVPPDDRLLGFARDTGVWLLLADRACNGGSLWSSWRNRGIGGRKSSRRSDAGARFGAPAWRTGAVHFWGASVVLSDLTPPGIRYGYVYPFARRLLRRSLPALGALPGVEFEPDLPSGTDAPTDVACVLAADHLDIGGVGRVVEMLAEGLRQQGVRPIVMCPGEGERTARLRASGIEVALAADSVTARQSLDRLGPVVVQTHSAPSFLVDAVLATPKAAIIPVLHNTEIHYDRPMWARTHALFSRSERVIAVSDVVRSFHLEHLPTTSQELIVVVPNGAMPVPQLSPDLRAAARRALEDVVGASLGSTRIFACLARYDSQKNIAGLVSSFLSASNAEASLVVAGDPSDWLEFHRANAIRLAHPAGNRVHLLGSSDAATLLAAADAFILDSFFEGWPLATTEAVAVGLPIIVSETGGARELVARAANGSVCIANPTGPAEAVTDARARRARRDALRQQNAEELAAAVERLVESVDSRGPTTASDTSYAEMVTAHAKIIRAAKSRRGA